MRTIKFRGMDHQTGEWIYGFYTEYTCPEYGYTEYEIDGVEITRETLGQFTGLLDKNGKEIYDGDIVRDEYGQVNSIDYSNGTYWFNWLEMPYYLDQVEKGEVIGNIHEEDKND